MATAEAKPRSETTKLHHPSPVTAGGGCAAIVKRLDDEPDITIRRALLLSLGEFTEKELSQDARTAMLPKLKEMYRKDADSGLHAAAEWLLRTWKQEAWLKQVNDDWAADEEERLKRFQGLQKLVKTGGAKTQPQWYVNSQAQTYIVIPGPMTFTMGSPKAEKDHNENEVQHQRQIGRSFAIAAKSVTLEQYRKLTGDKYEIGEKYTYDLTLPVVGINWYMAAIFCNKLSEKEDIPEDQWCYEIKGKAPDYVGTRLKENYLSLTGYRLPTEAEMEYAMRAGATSSRYYGETEELLGQYAWYTTSSNGVLMPVGRKKPNDLGLFDAQGNCFTWCQEPYDDYPEAEGEAAVIDKEGKIVAISTVSRVLRGGAFNLLASIVRSSSRNNNSPSNRNVNVGFRPARTFIP